MSDVAQQALTEEAVRSLFRYAEVKVEDQRISEKSGEYAELLSISRSEGFRPLGETPPASAFNADWE